MLNYLFLIIVLEDPYIDPEKISKKLSQTNAKILHHEAKFKPSNGDKTE